MESGTCTAGRRAPAGAAVLPARAAADSPPGTIPAAAPLLQAARTATAA